jgi:uncharacterized lipoprotein YddW (UPF0748 family)
VILTTRFGFMIEPTRATRYSLTVNLKSGCALTLGAFAGMFSAGGATVSYEPSSLVPPPPPREFRGAWVATVANLDWPSKPGLGTTEQKNELLTILDRAAQLKLNAIIFQVRPACDAMYASPIEPWSEYLTGTMGKAPEPFYDPLAFAVDEAHKRALELHAWFNPYRARHSNSKSPAAASHISKTRPQLVREYGKYLWLDPGEREVREYSLGVVMDVVKRYDVDGVHFDDYFYPYKESVGGKELDFPDGASWKKFGAGGTLSRDDWRRENVNAFIERVYKTIKTTKPWVKFGVSPFGIWRPGNPAQVKGLDAYAQLYADSRKWLRNGWLDYCAPQLYWAIEPKDQSFPVLLDWWNDQNPKQRHLWPGLDTAKIRSQADADGFTERAPVRTNSWRARVGWKPQEIEAQIRLSEKQPVSAGHIHWNLKSLLRSSELQSELERGLYAQPALVPACPWLGSTSPAKPRLSVSGEGPASVRAAWEAGGEERPSLWVLQYQLKGSWETKILSGEKRSLVLPYTIPEVLAMSAVDRVGKVSLPVALKLQR